MSCACPDFFCIRTVFVGTVEKISYKMYCVSIKNEDFNFVKSIVHKYYMVELRLDFCNFDLGQIKQLIALNSNIIATLRGKPQSIDKAKVLKTCIESGAKYVDLDINDNPISLIKDIRKYCNVSKRTQLILSVHNYNETPPIMEIYYHYDEAKNLGANLVKLVYFSNSEEDNKTVLSLYEKYDNLVAFNMGRVGQNTRLECLRLGAPFTYVSLDGEATAPGQLSIDTIKKYPCH